MNAKYHICSYIILILVLGGCEAGEAGWTTVALPDAGEHTIVAVDFQDEGHGMLVTSFRGDSRIYTSGDAGASWTRVHEVDFGLHDVVLTGEKTAVAVGNRGILHTADFGENWRLLEADVPEPIMAVDFYDSQQGLAVGRNGIILYTTDGGQSWSRQESGSNSFLKDVSFYGDGVAFAVGSEGAMLYTENSGRKWSERSSGVTEDINGIHFLDGDTGLGIGDYGLIMRSDDGGATWNRQEANTSSSLLGMHFIGTTGMVVGFEGTVLRTDDGGRTWEGVETGTSRGLYDVQMSAPESAVLVGDQATVLRRE